MKKTGGANEDGQPARTYFLKISRSVALALSLLDTEDARKHIIAAHHTHVTCGAARPRPCLFVGRAGRAAPPGRTIGPRRTRTRPTRRGRPSPQVHVSSEEATLASRGVGGAGGGEEGRWRRRKEGGGREGIHSKLRSQCGGSALRGCICAGVCVGILAREGGSTAGLTRRACPRRCVGVGFVGRSRRA